MTDTTGQKRVPNVRFKGFTDDWEQRKFLEVIDKIIDFRGRTPKKLGMSWSNTGYLALSALNVKKGYVDLSSSDAHYGNEELYNKWMHDNELHQGQVLLTTEAPMGNVAQVPDNAKYILSQRTIAFETELNEKFLAIILSTPTIQNRLKALSTGGTATGVSQKSLKFLSINFPNSDEQAKLGEIFTTLNKTITLYQRKFDLLKQLKKGLLQKTLVNKDENYPVLRFNNFKGNWKKVKVKNIFNVTRGKILATGKISNKRTPQNPYPVFSSQTKNNGLLGYYKDYLFNNGITWTTDGANAGTVNYRHGKFYSTNVNGVLLSKNGYSNKVVAEILNREAWKWVSHVGNPKLMNNVMSDISIVIPLSIAEQEKLSLMFTKLCKCESIIKAQISYLNNYKKYLLQQMFI